MPLEQFDAVVLPEHDKKPSLMKQDNIVWLAGAVSYVEQDMLDGEEDKLRQHYNIDPGTKICSVVSGGINLWLLHHTGKH